mmetsp:Transcript_183474/g.581953  ORF Transcript_183474/g.581953 Transcript_183474/m.581953 type:complete len:346 (-) Transcript_183474:78-1115(-)
MALRVPFHAPTLPAVAMMICGAEPAPLTKEYSRAARQTAMDLLQKEPTQRPTLKHLLHEPSSESDTWAALVKKQVDKLRSTSGAETPPSSVVSPHGSGSSEASTKASSGDERKALPQEMCDPAPASAPKRDLQGDRMGGDGAARRSSVQSLQSSHLQQQQPQQQAAATAEELERARLDTLEDRRLARQWALDHRLSNHDASSAASFQTATASRNGSAGAAGAGRGAKAQELHVEALARASREAAEAFRQRRCNSARTSVTSADSEAYRPNTARCSAVSSVPGSVAGGDVSATGSRQSTDFTEEYRQSLTRASSEAAEERKRLRDKFERNPVNWMGSVPENLVACT